MARGNEKGVVEGLVKFTRLNFFVPVPQVRDLEELNTRLRQQCLEDRQRRLRGKTGTKGQLLLEDQKAFLPLPASRFEACRKVSTTASSLSLVRWLPANCRQRPCIVHAVATRHPRVSARLPGTHPAMSVRFP